MFISKRHRLLKMRSRLYVALLVFLSSMTFPVLSGCDGKNKVDAITHNNDSLISATRKMEADLKATRDSLTAAKKELERLDSITKAKQVPVTDPKPQKPKYAPGLPAVDYGVPVYETPGIRK
jgi:outer membrane murein-binding lipoprotein Lpp